MKITNIKQRQILDSRGNPTVEAEVESAGQWFMASVPSGASTGTHEAVELRNKGKAFHGKAVTQALQNIKKMASEIKKQNFPDQVAFDAFLLDLDGTPNKSKFGANALLALSLAFARAHAGTKPLYADLAASLNKKPLLPLPFANVLNGGKHAGTPLKIQEFMLVPSGAKNLSEAVQMVAEVYQTLKKNAVEQFGAAAGNVGDEGGIAPSLKTTRAALDLIVAAIEENGYDKKISLAMDCAASEFYDTKTKKYTVDGVSLSPAQLTQFYLDLHAEYGFVSLEDPFHEEAFSDFAFLTKKLKKKAQVVGDDLLVTNPARIRNAKDSCSALLLKVNQIGTLTESIQASELASGFGWNVMVSHRSGETEDAFISDLATALACGQIKLGAPCRGERTAKYNRLLRIEEDGVTLARFNLP